LKSGKVKSDDRFQIVFIYIRLLREMEF